MSMKEFRFYILIALFLAMALPVRSQGFDPRPVLGTIISAFQNCGPPGVYQMLSPQLLNVVVQQTGGSGCYPAIASAGPVQSMQIVGQQIYPLGPIFVIRVAHTSVIADWTIGFNQFTSKVEYLTFQSANNAPILPQPGSPPVGTPSGGGTPPPPGGGSPTTPSGSDDGCDLYPTMCQ